MSLTSAATRIEIKIWISHHERFGEQKNISAEKDLAATLEQVHAYIRQQKKR